MAATDSAINTAVAQNGSFKSSCRVATTANITLSGTQTIDGVSVIAGDRVLVKNQTTASNNGPYVVSAGSWSRTTDTIVADVAFFIEEGTANADLLFYLTTNNPITVGSTSLTFSTFGGTSSGASGSVQFSGGSGTFSSDGSNLFWDNTNKRLGIGTNTPGVDIEIKRTSGNTQLTIGNTADSAAVQAIALNTNSGGMTLQAFGSTSSTPLTAVVRASSAMSGGLRLSSGNDTTGIKMFVSNGITVDTLAFTLAPGTFAATFVGALSASNFSGSSSGTNTGDMVMAAFSNTSGSQGATITSQQLTLRAADGTNPGGVSTTTQTFAGDKTFTGSITTTKASGNTLVVDTSTLVVDATNHRVGIGQATPGNALHMTTTIAGGVTASLFDIASTGSASSGPTSMRVNLTAGYTGVGGTTAFLALNTTAGTANTLSNNNANYGARGQVNVSTAGANVGVFGTGANSTALNVGVYGQSFNPVNGATNVAILGQALNTGTTPTQIGGYFLLSGPAGTDPGNYTSAALIADNGGTSSPIFLARANGTTAFTISSTGSITATQNITSSVASGSAAFTMALGARLDGGAAAAANMLWMSSSTAWRTDSILRGGDLQAGNNTLTGTSALAFQYVTNQTDGATNVAHIFNITNTMSTAGAKLFSIRNNGTEQLSFDKTGQIANAVDQAFTLTSSRTDGANNVGIALNATNGSNGNFKIVSFQNAGSEVANIKVQGGMEAAKFVTIQAANNPAQFTSSVTQTVAARWGWYGQAFTTDQANAHHCTIGEANNITASPNTQVLLGIGYQITTTGGGTYPVQVMGSGRIDQSYADSSGTPGNVTNNNPTGRAAIAAGASAVTVTCAACTSTASIVQIQVETADGTLGVLIPAPGTGSFTVTNYIITGGTATATNVTGNTKFSYTVQNP